MNTTLVSPSGLLGLIHALFLALSLTLAWFSGSLLKGFIIFCLLWAPLLLTHIIAALSVRREGFEAYAIRWLATFALLLIPLALFFLCLGLLGVPFLFLI